VAGARLNERLRKEIAMEGSLLRFYVHENQRVHGRPAWEWLLEQANGMGLRGGSAFRAMAGFGRHHQLQENHFFELAGTLTIEVEFVVSDEEATRLLELVKRERLRLFHAQMPARFGIVE
jgi:PII-like signaling protein